MWSGVSSRATASRGNIQPATACLAVITVSGLAPVAWQAACSNRASAARPRKFFDRWWTKTSKRSDDAGSQEAPVR